MHMPYLELVRLIRGAGKRPVERDSLYQPVRDQFDDPPPEPSLRRGRRAAGGARRMRLGRIPWINCYPVYGAIDRGLVPRAGRAGHRHRVRAERSAGRGRARGQRGLRGRVRPQRGRATICCPTSRSPATGRCTAWRSSPGGRSTELDGPHGAASPRSSRTSVLLLELLCRHRWGVTPQLRDRAAPRPRTSTRSRGLPHDARARHRRRRAACSPAERALSGAGRPRRGVEGSGPGCRSSSRSGRPGGTPVDAVQAVHRAAARVARLGARAPRRARRSGRGATPASPSRCVARTSAIWTTRCPTGTSRGSPTSSAGWPRTGWCRTGRSRSSRRRRQCAGSWRRDLITCNRLMT